MSCTMRTVQLQSKKKGSSLAINRTPSSTYVRSLCDVTVQMSRVLIDCSRLSIPANQNSRTKQWLWCPHSIHDLDENLQGKGEEAYCLPTELTRRLKQYVLQPKKCNGGLGFGIPRRLKSRKDNLVHGHCLHLVSDFLQDYSIPVSRKVERGIAMNNERKVK